MGGRWLKWQGSPSGQSGGIPYLRQALRLSVSWFYVCLESCRTKPSTLRAQSWGLAPSWPADKPSFQDMHQQRGDLKPADKQRQDRTAYSNHTHLNQSGKLLNKHTATVVCAHTSTPAEASQEGDVRAQNARPPPRPRATATSSSAYMNKKNGDFLSSVLALTRRSLCHQAASAPEST